jgi:hypothetical protein
MKGVSALTDMSHTASVQSSSESHASKEMIAWLMRDAHHDLPKPAEALNALAEGVSPTEMQANPNTAR